jgi:hypothetical protein
LDRNPDGHGPESKDGGDIDAATGAEYGDVTAHQARAELAADIRECDRHCFAHDVHGYE